MVIVALATMTLPSPYSTLFPKAFNPLGPSCFVLLILLTGSWCLDNKQRRHHDEQQLGTATGDGELNTTSSEGQWSMNETIEEEEFEPCFQDDYISSRCTKSIRVKPPHFYRMLWLDETSVLNQTTGFWVGNAITLKYTLNKEFLLVTRFEKIEDSFYQRPMFYSNYRASNGIEKLRRRIHTPAVSNVFNRVSPAPANFYEDYKPRHVVRFGTSNFVINVLLAYQIGDEPEGIDDYPPDLELNPKCYAIRYLVYRGKGQNQSQVFELKTTPVTVFKRLNEYHRFRTMAKVARYQDSFFWYHAGMPIMCNEKLAYIIKADLDKGASKEVRVVSVHYLLSQLYKWVSGSMFKSLDGLPVPEPLIAFNRFG